MNITQQHTAELDVGASTSQCPIYSDHRIQQGPLPRRKLVELGTQAALQILQNHWDQRDIGDAIANKGIAHELRTQSPRSEEHTSELQSRFDLVCRLLLEKKKYTAPPTSNVCSVCGK